MKRLAFFSALLILVALAAPSQAQVVMLAPTSATTSMGTFNSGGLGHLYDQSGLSSTYTSLTTSYSTYTAGNPTHDSSSVGTIWISNPGSTSGTIDFNLGGSYAVQNFLLWNANPGAGTRVTGFQLLGSADSTFTTTTNLGTFTASPTGSATAVDLQSYALTPTIASYVRMVVTSTASTSGSALGEVAFGVTPAASVPEPSPLALAAVVGALGAAWRLRASRKLARG